MLLEPFCVSCLSEGLCFGHLPRSRPSLSHMVGGLGIQPQTGDIWESVVWVEIWLVSLFLEMNFLSEIRYFTLCTWSFTNLPCCRGLAIPPYPFFNHTITFFTLVMIFGSQSGAGDWIFWLFYFELWYTTSYCCSLSQFGLWLWDWHSVKSEQNSDNLTRFEFCFDELATKLSLKLRHIYYINLTAK